MTVRNFCTLMKANHFSNDESQNPGKSFKFEFDFATQNSILKYFQKIFFNSLKVLFVNVKIILEKFDEKWQFEMETFLP